MIDGRCATEVYRNVQALEMFLSGTGTAEYARKKNNKEMSDVTDETRCVYGGTRRLMDESRELLGS